MDEQPVIPRQEEEEEDGNKILIVEEDPGVVNLPSSSAVSVCEGGGVSSYQSPQHPFPQFLINLQLPCGDDDCDRNQAMDESDQGEGDDDEFENEETDICQDEAVGSTLEAGGGENNQKEEKAQQHIPVPEDVLVEGKDYHDQGTAEVDVQKQDKKLKGNEKPQVKKEKNPVQTSEGVKKPMSKIKPSLFIVATEEDQGHGFLQSFQEPLPKAMVARMLPTDDDDENWDRELSKADSDQAAEDYVGTPEGDMHNEQTTDSGKSSSLEIGLDDQDGEILEVHPRGEEEVQVVKDATQYQVTDSGTSSSLEIGLVDQDGKVPEEHLQGEEKVQVDEDPEQATSDGEGKGSTIEAEGGDQDEAKLPQQMERDEVVQGEGDTGQVQATAEGQVDKPGQKENVPVQATKGGEAEDEPGSVLQPPVFVVDVSEEQGQDLPQSSHAPISTSITSSILPRGGNYEEWVLRQCMEAYVQDCENDVEDYLQLGDFHVDLHTSSGTSSTLEIGRGEDDQDRDQAQDDSEQGQEDFKGEEGTQEELDEEMYQDPPQHQERSSMDEKLRELHRIINQTAYLSTAEIAARRLHFNLGHEQRWPAADLPIGSLRGQVGLPNVFSRVPDHVLYQCGSVKPTSASVIPPPGTGNLEKLTSSTTSAQHQAIASDSQSSTQTSPEPQPRHSKSPPSTSTPPNQSIDSDSPCSTGVSTDPPPTATSQEQAVDSDSGSQASNKASTDPQPHHSRNPPLTSFTPHSSSALGTLALPILHLDSYGGKPQPLSESAFLKDFSNKSKCVLEEGSFIRSSFIVGDVGKLTLYAYKITSASASVKMSSEARDNLLRNILHRVSVYEDVAYSLTKATRPGEPFTISSYEHVLTFQYIGTEPSTSGNFRNFFQDRMEEIVGASRNMFKMGPAKWLFETPPRDAFPVHHLNTYNYVELQVKVLGQRIVAFIRDGILVVHTTPVSRQLIATSSQAVSHQAFVAMSREKLIGRTIVFSRGLHFNRPGWRILKVNGVRPQAEDRQVREFRLLYGEQQEVDPSLSYLAGYSNWEVNDTTVYPDLKSVLERSPQTSYDVRLTFMNEMINSRQVQLEMREAGLNVIWDYLVERMTTLPRVTLQMDRHFEWSGLARTHHLNWTTVSLHNAFWTRGQSIQPWSYVASSLNQTERENLVDTVLTNLNRARVTLPTMLPPKVSRSFEDALLNAIISIQRGTWKPEILLIFNPYNNVGPILSFIKTMMELYRVNCIIVPPLKSLRLVDAARRIARNFNIKLGGIPWRIRDFPARTMILSVVSGLTRTQNPRKFCAGAGTVGLAIANKVSFAMAGNGNAAHLDLDQALPQVLTCIINSLKEQQDFELPEKIVLYSDERFDLMEMEDFIQRAISKVLPSFASRDLILIQAIKIPHDLWCEQRYPNSPVRNVNSGVFLIEGSGFYLQSTTNKDGGSQHPAYYEVVNLTPHMNLVELADITYQATFNYFHDTEPSDIPAVLVYSQDSLVYAQHGIGEGIIHLPLIMGFWNRS